MCGIAAICGIANPGQFETPLKQALRHRGPDGSGSFVHNSTMLVHTRLAIIDISPAGNQPLLNEDKDVVLVCNGEIYNFKDLRIELQKLGHVFTSQSDSEVILHLYEEHWENPSIMLNKLRGMFAFVLYDLKRKQLLAARDRFGIKPLYWCQTGSTFAFASEIGAITALPFVEKSIDYTSLFEYVQFLSVPEPNTIYEQIKAVDAGSYWLVSAGKSECHIWYDALDVLSHIPEMKENVVPKLEAKLKEVVGVHMVSDVPVGSFLSAGIDSTLVTKLAAACTEIPFTTISASFAGAPEDESVVATDTARILGLPHFAVPLHQQHSSQIHHITPFFDQPFAVSSAYALFDISKAAARHMKVVLTGDGGDEIFAGYDYKHRPFYQHRILQLLPKRLHPAFAALLKLLPSATAKAMMVDMKLSIGDRFLNRSRIFTPEESLSIINANFHQRIDVHRFKRSVDTLFSKIAHLPVVRQLLLADVMTFLKSEMLYKVDRMTMANGIEARVPLLDHQLVEMAFGIPLSMLRNEKEGKILLRNMVADFLPTIAARQKTGFNTPRQSTPSYLTLSTNKRIASLLNLQDYALWPDEKKFYLGYIKNGIANLSMVEN